VLLADTRFTELANGFLDYYSELRSKDGRRLNSSDAMFLVHLLRFKWDQYDPHPSYLTVATAMGIQVPAVRKIAKKLESMELIKRIPRREKGRDGKDGQWLGNAFALNGLRDALEAAILKEQPGLQQRGDEDVSEVD